MEFGTFITIGTYIGLLLAFLWAVKSERQDLYCPSPNCDACYKGNGAAYAQGIPTDQDTKEELLEKLKISCRYDINSVTWRRCLIFAILTGFIVALFLKGVPSGAHLLLAVFTIYLISYLMCEFYKYELSKPALRHVDDTINRIRRGQVGCQVDPDTESESEEGVPDINQMVEELEEAEPEPWWI